MYFVRNSYKQNHIPEPWEHDEILKHIERIGRICYRSDDKITEGSATRFIDTLRNNKHWAMLEHYIFNISIPKEVYDSILDPEWFSDENTDYIQALKFIQLTRWDYDGPREIDPELQYIISGSATTFNNLWACDCVRLCSHHGIHQICRFLQSFIPELMVDPRERIPTGDPDYWRGQFDPRIKFLSRDVIHALPPRLRKIHEWMSVHFVVERSSTHDLVRHRPLVSYAQESTRYCNYDKKGICFIIPVEFCENDKRILEDTEKVEIILRQGKNNVNFGISEEACDWLFDLKTEADFYTTFINTHKWQPQRAKSVMPHALRAEINITTFLGEWHHIFDMRADRAAYPQIQEVMCPLLSDCICENPDIFMDLKSKVDDWRSRYPNVTE